MKGLTAWLEVKRLARKEAAFRRLNANLLFFAGLALAALFLATSALSLRLVEATLFALCAWAVGQKLHPWAILLTGISVVAINLFTPVGEELWRLGAFSVTRDALFEGIDKALTLEALILLSHATVRSDLRLPGRFGALLSEAFRQLERLLAMKKRFSPKDPIGSLDAILIDLSAGAEAGREELSPSGPGAAPEAGDIKKGQPRR